MKLVLVSENKLR